MKMSESFDRLMVIKKNLELVGTAVDSLLKIISPQTPKKRKKKLVPVDPTGLAWKQALLYIKSLPASRRMNRIKNPLRTIYNDKRQNGRSIRVAGWHPARYRAVKKALKSKYNIDAEVTVSRPGSKYFPARCRLLIKD